MGIQTVIWGNPEHTTVIVDGREVIPADREDMLERRGVKAWVAAGNVIGAPTPPEPPAPAPDAVVLEAMRAKLSTAELDAARQRLSGRKRQ